MGNIESNGVEACSTLLQLIATTPPENLPGALDDALDGVVHPEALLELEIPPAHCLSIVAALAPIVHKKALAINASYSSLKEGEVPNTPTEGVLTRLLVLNKAVLGSLADSSKLSDYLWHVDGTADVTVGSARRIPTAIHLAEACSVLLFTNGLTTFFDSVKPPSSPLENDERINWSNLKGDYDMYSAAGEKCIRVRYTLMLLLLHLAHCSKQPEHETNAFLGMMSNRLWKNVKTMLISILSLTFEMGKNDPYLEKQEDLAKLRCICLYYLLMCIHNKTNGSSKTAEIVQTYINQKALIMKSKLGLDFPEEAKLLSKSYISEYMTSLNSERLSIIFTGFRDSLRHLLSYLYNKEISDDSECIHLVVSEAFLFLHLLTINPFWGSFSEDLALHNIMVDLLSLLLWHTVTLDHEVVVLFGLIVAILSRGDLLEKSRSECCCGYEPAFCCCLCRKYYKRVRGDVWRLPYKVLQ
eukprot:TRINITY_DN4754_c0_g1_i1.p1 TRINITY_DN4754_c0_g1~~TRINITY_DN4754_c0_g1_i1.p1  ORF type:complete len:470 (+),score=63.86 TRINITY_DN4754_c0_g1_i1:132-1541(+)